MMPNLSRFIHLCTITLFVFGLGIAPTTAQDWLHPDLQTPLPQYVPKGQEAPANGRYPLQSETRPVATRVPATTPQPTTNLPGTGWGDSLSADQLAPNPLSADGQLRDPGPTSQRPVGVSEKEPLENQDRPSANRSSTKKPKGKSSTSKKPNRTDKKGDKKTDDKKKKETKKSTSIPPLNYDIYRDRNPYPIDPRKPCSICTNPKPAPCGCESCQRGLFCAKSALTRIKNAVRPCGCGSCSRFSSLPGLHGRPYQEKEPGGCNCGNKNFPMKHPMFSVYWPRPFNARKEQKGRDSGYIGCGNGCGESSIADVFDPLVNFKLINYQRPNNPHCGSNREKFGCLGESKQVFESAHHGVVDYHVADFSANGHPEMESQVAGYQTGPTVQSWPAHETSTIQPLPAMQASGNFAQPVEHLSAQPNNLDRYPAFR